jgi:hypothetical protein
MVSPSIWKNLKVDPIKINVLTKFEQSKPKKPAIGKFAQLQQNLHSIYHNIPLFEGGSTVRKNYNLGSVDKFSSASL